MCTLIGQWVCDDIPVVTLDGYLICQQSAIGHQMVLMHQCLGAASVMDDISTGILSTIPVQ